MQKLHFLAVGISQTQIPRVFLIYHSVAYTCRCFSEDENEQGETRCRGILQSQQITSIFLIGCVGLVVERSLRDREVVNSSLDIGRKIQSLTVASPNVWHLEKKFTVLADETLEKLRFLISAGVERTPTCCYGPECHTQV